MERKHVILAAIFSAISGNSRFFIHAKMIFLYNDIFFSRIVNEIIEIARIFLSIL